MWVFILVLDKVRLRVPTARDRNTKNVNVGENIWYDVAKSFVRIFSICNASIYYCSHVTHASARHGKVIAPCPCLMLSLEARCWSMGNTLAPKKYNLLPCTVRTSRQWSCNQRVGCRLCSMARIYDLWDGSCPCRYNTIELFSCARQKTLI